MDEKQIFDYALNPEKLISPQDCNQVIAFLNGRITDLEETEYEQQLVADAKLNHLVNENSAAKALIMWKITDEYKKLKLTQKSLRQMRRYRDTLRGRFDVLMRTKQFIRENI